MKKKLMWLLMSVMVLMSSLPVYADDSALVEEETVDDINKLPFDVFGILKEFCNNYGENYEDYQYYYFIRAGSGANWYCAFAKSPLTISYVDSVPYIDISSCRTVMQGSGSTYEIGVYFYKFPLNDWFLAWNNSDVYDSLGNVVFPSAPYQLKTGQLLIGALTAQKVSRLTMKEIVGLVPLVIGLIIFSLALRKAWGMLSQLLHRA